MTTTIATRTSFRSAILAVLECDSASWPQPVIYAQDIDGAMIFDACNAPAMPSDAIPWMYIEADSFGDLSGNNEDDAAGIDLNMFEAAVNDTNDAADLA